jgi:hypothetical protein
VIPSQKRVAIRILNQKFTQYLAQLPDPVIGRWNWAVRSHSAKIARAPGGIALGPERGELDADFPDLGWLKLRGGVPWRSNGRST